MYILSDVSNRNMIDLGINFLCRVDTFDFNNNIHSFQFNKCLQPIRMQFCLGEENTTDQSYKYLNNEEMRGLGDDSMQIDVTSDEKEKKESINR